MILAVETATDVCGVSLVDEGRVLASRIVVEKNIHSESLLPMVDRTLNAASIPASLVDAVAVSIGPGSFTGLRIGLSTAKGIAKGLQKAIIPVPTLDALAYEWFRKGVRRAGQFVCPLLDAKRQEAFFCFYGVEDAGPTRRSDYQIAPLPKIIEEASRFPDMTFIGDASAKIEATAGRRGSHRCDPAVLCNPESVGLLAELSGRSLSPAEYSSLEPLYLRTFVTTEPGSGNLSGRRFGPGGRHTAAGGLIHSED